MQDRFYTTPDGYTLPAVCLSCGGELDDAYVPDVSMCYACNLLLFENDSVSDDYVDTYDDYDIDNDIPF